MWTGQWHRQLRTVATARAVVAGMSLGEGDGLYNSDTRHPRWEGLRCLCGPIWSVAVSNNGCFVA